MIELSIVAMALLVFASRYVLISPAISFKLNSEFQQFMSHCAPAVLTAIWAPLVFIQQQELALSYHNPYLIGAITAVLLALITRRVLVTSLISMLVFALLTHGPDKLPNIMQWLT